MTCYGMIAIFSALLPAELAALILLTRFFKRKGINKPVRLLAAAVWLGIFVFTAKLLIAPPIRAAEPTGEYAVTSEDYWLVEDGADPYAEDGELRQLQIRRWEPVGCTEALPVVVASHGSCGSINNNVTLYRELASHGYTVLAVCHSGQAASMTRSDGKTTGPSLDFLKQMTSVQPDSDPEDAFGIFKEWMAIRVEDLQTVMDAYAESRGDTEFVMLGHSLGGSAAYAMARLRGDVVACIALEAPFMYDITGVQNGAFVFDETPYTVPLLNIYSDSTYGHLREWSQYKENADMLDEENELYTNIHYQGVGHMGLCDLSQASPLFAAIMDGGWQKTEAKTQLEQINADCLAWLAQVTGANGN